MSLARFTSKTNKQARDFFNEADRSTIKLGSESKRKIIDPVETNSSKRPRLFFTMPTSDAPESITPSQRRSLTANVDHPVDGLPDIINPMGTMSAPSVQDDTDDPSSKTQRGRLLQDFIHEFPDIQDHFIVHEYDSRATAPCSCGVGTCLIQCRDCLQYDMSCQSCYLQRHRYNPLHWVHLWDQRGGYFKKLDASLLSTDSGPFAIQLGHNGMPCPSPYGSGPSKLTIVHTNGIHGTLVRYCACNGTFKLNKARQLMAARLLPATIRDPKTAFSFTVMSEFRMHNLESKLAAYDYHGALRRLTDENFTFQVPNTYHQFLLAIRVHRHLSMTQHSGQMHEIDKLLPNRAHGNLMDLCLACPEEGVNITKEEIVEACHDPDTKSLVLEKIMADGNFQTGQYAKNTDPHDQSLCGGNAVFAQRSTYDGYLKEAVNTPEKSTCTFLKAANQQDTSKFRGMAITGTVMIACEHGLPISLADLRRGEGFPYADFALARALSRRASGQTIPRIMSYDINCQYTVKLLARFKSHFPELAHHLDDMEFTIPAVHIQNHLAWCMYLFGSAYKRGAGHFHGETIEQIWANINEVAGQTRQMNAGNRHDALSDHIADWNDKKLMMLSYMLARQIKQAVTQYKSTKAHFLKVTASYKVHIESWSKMPRKPITDPANPHKLISSVYQMATATLPTLKELHERATARERERNLLLNAPLGPEMQPDEFLLPSWVEKAIRIQEEQLLLKRLDKLCKHHPLEDRLKKLQVRRAQLWSNIRDLRSAQPRIIPAMGPLLSGKDSEVDPAHPEEEVIHLPSSLTPPQREKLDLKRFAELEVELRRGYAYDLLQQVQLSVKDISVAKYRKRKDARGQDGNTRAALAIEELQSAQDHYIEAYNHSRHALMVLGSVSTDSDPSEILQPLAKKDCVRKPTHIPRLVGDSRRLDYHPYDIRHHLNGSEEVDDLELLIVDPQSAENQDSHPDIFPGTQMNRRKEKGARNLTQKELASESTGGNKENPFLEGDDLLVPGDDMKNGETRGVQDGWIWRIRRPSDPKDERDQSNESLYLQEWDEESIRVEWFRAEAEMQRWREEIEIRHAQLLRVITGFTTMSQIWKNLAEKQAESRSRQAYASMRSAIYSRRAHDAQAHLDKASIKALKVGSDHRAIIASVRRFQTAEIQSIRNIVTQYQFVWDSYSN